MARFFEALNDRHIQFIEAQPMFFTATACATGRVNLSPKGLDTFRVLGPNLCGYLDLTGSGNETAAHIKNDGRITIMFNSFDKAALIMRLYGKGRILRPQHPDFDRFSASFPDMEGSRQIILIDIETVQTSCGYGVPHMTLDKKRDTLEEWVDRKGSDGIQDYQQKENVVSIDGFETGLNDQ